uniref:Ig-like domain-containing protein n=1 Tax=Poecilia formosa TaxID=48698 RepID=A0A096M9I5_POEFO
WTYEWRTNYRNSPTSSEYKIIAADRDTFSCRGRRNYQFTQWSDDLSLTVLNKPAAKLTASDTIIPAGGSVTLTCSVSGSDGWKFDLLRRQSVDHKDQFIRTNEPDGVFIISDEGVYSCRGGRGDPVFYTETSIKVIINEIGQLVPVLSVSPSWLNPGASVTLSCEGLEHQPAGWRFFWYKAVPDPSVSYYRFELLPGTSGTEQNFTINGPTHTAGFVCRAGRGEPVNYTDYSEPKFIWSADPRPAASLSVNPDRVQHFRSESVSLSCEGNSAEWRVKRFTETGKLSNFSNWGTINGSTCNITSYWFNSGVYWCESGSGEFSNAVNITVHDDDSAPLLLSPVHPVTEGDPVTLSCRDKKQQLLSNVFFYHNDELLDFGSRGELNISAVSKSDEGFYKCQHSGKDSPRSWMSVRGEEEENV